MTTSKKPTKPAGARSKPAPATRPALEFLSPQLIERVLAEAIDNEACGMAHRIVAGVQPRGKRLAEHLLGNIGSGEHLLTSPVTLKWFRDEILRPNRIIDREMTDSSDGSGGIFEHARERIKGLLAEHNPAPMPPDVQAQLTEIMTVDARRHGMNALPEA